MWKKSLIFGLLMGLALCGFMYWGIYTCYNNPNFESNDLLGWTIMIAMCSLIFFGIRNYRNTEMNGYISFGKALGTGALIALISCTMYVVVWLVLYYNFFPDFIDKYMHHVLNEASRNGATAAELNQTMLEMTNFKEMYKSPFFVIIITYSEVLPLALLVALVSALVLRKPPKAAL